MDKFAPIINRLKEPSTWAGLGIFASMLGMPPGTFDLVHMAVAGIAGLIAVALPEGPKA